MGSRLKHVDQSAVAAAQSNQHLQWCSSHSYRLSAYLGYHAFYPKQFIKCRLWFCMQAHAGGVDAGLQFLDSSDRALCKDRCQAAAAPSLCYWHERHQAVAALVLLWLPQQCHEATPEPGVLLCLGGMAVFSGAKRRFCNALLQCSCCVAVSSCRAATLLPVFAADWLVGALRRTAHATL